MKILFVYPNVNRQTTPQMGVASLMQVIHQKHQLAFFDFTLIEQDRIFTEYVNALRSVSPDYVMVSCRSLEWFYVKKLIEISYPTPVIVGGIHPTIDPQEVLSYAKIVVRGEGEEATEELLDKLQAGKDVRNIPNVWSKYQGKIYANEVRPLINDLDALPLPYWKLFNEVHFRGSYIRNLFKDIECVGTFETSRGCPYSCTYCANDYLQNLYRGKGKYHRNKSPQRVVKEISEFKKLYPDCNFIYFVDDTFMVDLKWLEDFSRIYDKTPFVFMTRPEMVTSKKMKMVSGMGAKAVSIGIESGNEKFRKEVLNRKMSNEQIIQAFKTAKDYGLDSYSFNLVGLPYESPDDIQLTIELNKLIKPTKAQFTIFYPFKGTKLFEICQKEGYLTDNQVTNYYGDSVLNLPNFKKGEVAEWARKATQECN